MPADSLSAPQKVQRTYFAPNKSHTQLYAKTPATGGITKSQGATQQQKLQALLDQEGIFGKFPPLRSNAHLGKNALVKEGAISERRSATSVDVSGLSSDRDRPRPERPIATQAPACACTCKQVSSIY